MPQILADVGGFVNTDIHVPEMDLVLLPLETQLLLWNATEFFNITPKIIETEEAKADAIDALQDMETIVKAGKMLHWNFMIGIGRKPE
jgi:hypothetical protein